MLAQGLLNGLSMGLLAAPAMAVVGHYFRQKRAIAMGIAVSASSIGGVISPVMLNRLLNSTSMGFGWSVRIVGFLALALLTFSCLTLVERLPPRGGSLFLPSIFKDPVYVLAVTGLFLTLWGLYTPLYYIVTYSEAHGVGTEIAFYMQAIMNGASFFGRVIPGIAADRFGVFEVILVMNISTAILEFCWILTKSDAGIIVFAAIYGLCSGAIVSMFPACLSQIAPSPDVIGTYIGEVLI
jgi:MFS family permease